MKMKRMAMLWLALCLLLSCVWTATAEGGEVDWTEEERARLRVGSTTPLQGRFFTSMWGAATSDLDVQELLHACSPVIYDAELTRFRFDHSVVQDATAMDDEQGNRTYLLIFYDNMRWSDGTPITARDYAFSILFTMDPAIRETGGTPMDYSWLDGADEYLDGTRSTVSGLRILSDQILQIRVKADALPFFYELSRLMIYPYPASVLAPGITAGDEGEGAFLSAPLTAEGIRQAVLDPETGYLSHPTVVSGPYILESYEAPTAKFTINEFFKGTEEGIQPRIGQLEYTLAYNTNMIDLLRAGNIDLLNKVTLSETVRSGIMNQGDSSRFGMDNYARTGLTLLWFMESSPKLQDLEVRQAIAWCFDRQAFTQDYTGPFGVQMDVFSGLGQWMYRLVNGQTEPPVDGSLPEAEYRVAAQAYDGLNLDGITTYRLDPVRAADALSEAGWTRGPDGTLRRERDGETVELKLVLGIPESEEAAEALQNDFLRHLDAIGIRVTVKKLSMLEIAQAYRGESRDVDLLYLGENFSISMDPAILAPRSVPAEGQTPENSLSAARQEVYDLAREMVRTEPDDLAGFVRKWISLQEGITRNLPLLPVYSNVYFDFFNRELHDYRITEAVTWGGAVVKSYMSDLEVLPEEEQQTLRQQLTELQERFEQTR